MFVKQNLFFHKLESQFPIIPENLDAKHTYMTTPLYEQYLRTSNLVIEIC